MTPLSPKPVEIPSRAVREATPKEMAAMTVEYTGDVFAAVIARPVVALSPDAP